MRRRDVSLTIAICVSLCVHAWVIHALIGGEYLGSAFATPRVYLIQKHAATKPTSGIELIRLPAKPKLLQPPMDTEEQFGEINGRGKAINSMTGDKPLRAKQSDEEQASLSRHPGSTNDHSPSQATAVQKNAGDSKQGGRNGNAEKMLAALMPQQKQQMAMVGVAPSEPMLTEKKETVPAGQTISANQKQIAKEESRPVKPQQGQTAKEQAKSESLAKTATANNQPERKEQVAAGTGGGNTAGRVGNVQPAMASDPGQLSESESDAFSNVGSAVLEYGKLDARFGRKVKTVRPDFTIAGRVDLSTFAAPSVQLEVHADATGKPTEVDVIQGSGSNNIDEPVRLALYKWWFEPPKDRRGKPMADVMVWTISFR